MKSNNEIKNKKNVDSFTSLRVKKGTKDHALKILESINKKDWTSPREEDTFLGSFNS